MSFGAVDGGGPRVRGMLGGSRGVVLETVEGTSDVARHGNIHGTGGVVPLEIKATILGTGPVRRDGVNGLQTVEEMLGVFTADVLDAEVVNNQTEHDRAGVMAKETGGVGGLVVTVLGEMGDKAVVGNDSGLG